MLKKVKLMFSRLRRKNNDLMVKKPSEEVLKAHNEAEIIIKENNVDRFLLNMFMDKKGINHFNTIPEFRLVFKHGFKMPSSNK